MWVAHPVTLYRAVPPPPRNMGADHLLSPRLTLGPKGKPGSLSISEILGASNLVPDLLPEKYISG